LHEHPHLTDPAVDGIPNERWGEVGIAFVVADGVTDEELIEWCRGRLARFKVPESVRFVDEIPRNGLGKIQKQELVTEVAR
jgi:acyl-CoA synthetase (AMP-forming)/AMP-acid ligase II